jgi:hypothetical protein
VIIYHFSSLMSKNTLNGVFKFSFACAILLLADSYDLPI